MAQHRSANFSGQDSAVHLHLKEKKYSFKDNDVNILAREDRWFERGVSNQIKSIFICMALFIHKSNPYRD